MVVIIIGILAAIAIPVFLSQREKAQTASVEADLRTAGTAATTCFAETSDFSACGDAETLDEYGFNNSTQVDITFADATEDALTINGAHNVNDDITGSWVSATGQVTMDGAVEEEPAE